MAAASARKMRTPTPKPYLNYLKRLIVDPQLPLVAMVALFVAEIIVNAIVIWKIKYTEIDWVAYMQEVEGVVNGTYDYMQLKGDTGPLVYPAGFVYIFTGLYYITQQGSNIRLAQFVFAALYLINLVIVFKIYKVAKKIPPYAFFFMCALSYRIHSIYILRLFNDPVAMVFLYAAVYCFLKGRWSWGCLLFSFGVSIKMNLLLFAPGLLYLLLATQGFLGTIKHLVICALPQVVLAIPFLMANPVGYIVRSFDLSRQFFYVWTVNWRLVPEEIFLNKYFQLGLLCGHIVLLLLFFTFKWTRYFPRCSLQVSDKGLKKILHPDHILFPLFSSNFIGMCFSRSLHYQFYVWYFHGLHYLVWTCPYPTVLRILILGLIEWCWNTYPSTVASSSVLHVCHALILIGLLLSRSHQHGREQSKGSNPQKVESETSGLDKKGEQDKNDRSRQKEKSPPSKSAGARKMKSK